MGELEETLEELQAKLEQYKEQLEQVDAALAQQENEELVKLRSDLKEVISLTEHLVSYKAVGEVAKAKAEAQIEEKEEPEPTAKVRRPKHTGESGKEGATRIGGQLLGRTVQAEYNGKRFYGSILEVKANPSGEQVLVEFFGWKNQELYPLKKVRLLEAPPADTMTPGTAAQAIFSQDGKWYDCTIDSRTSDGYMVTYSEYGNREEVKSDQVRIKIQLDQLKRKSKEIITAGGYRIPQYLTIKHTDTQNQRDSKKRRVKAIKAKQKEEQAEQQLHQTAQSWQNFNKKAQGRSLGLLKGRSRESIFRDVEVIHDTHAAVVNAPKTNFVPRRKHDFDEGLLPDD